MNHLPRLIDSGQVAIISSDYPPAASGSSIVMRNLLSCFHPDSFSLITTRRYTSKSIDSGNAHKTYYASVTFDYSGRIDKILQKLLASQITRRVCKAIEQIKPRVIMGIYPHLHFFCAAREAAKYYGIPWVAYLHDAIIENGSRMFSATEAARLRSQVFEEASSILVMSQGMADLYKSRCGIHCTPLEHCHVEPVPHKLAQSTGIRRAFWGGAIYAINQNSVLRVSRALERSNWRFEITGKSPVRRIKRVGLNAKNIEHAFYPKRQEYLEGLQRQAVLILALDWPDESPVDADELATIFPTKAVEYLASGQPILVHCPGHYFLARFFNEHGCGLVVSERNERAIEEAIGYLAQDNISVRGMRMSALKIARMFSMDRVGGILRAELKKIVVREKN